MKMVKQSHQDNIYICLRHRVLYTYGAQMHTLTQTHLNAHTYIQSSSVS